MEQLPPVSAGWAGVSVRGPLRQGEVRGDQHRTSRRTSTQPPGLDKRVGLDDATNSADDNDRRRRRGTIKAFTLGEILSASGFRESNLNSYTNVASASKTSQIKILKWFQEVDSCKQVTKLEAPSCE